MNKIIKIVIVLVLFIIIFEINVYAKYILKYKIDAYKITFHKKQEIKDNSINNIEESEEKIEKDSKIPIVVQIIK